MEDSKHQREEARNEKMFRKLTTAIDNLTAGANNLAHAIRDASSSETIAILKRIEKNTEKFMITQTELAAGLTALQTQVGKVALEQSARFDVLTAKIAELTAIIDAGGTIGPEVETAFEAVKTALQSLDDVIPDAPTTQ